MRIVPAEQVSSLLTYGALIDALAEAFCGEIAVPIRHHHTVPREGADATLLLMPAWTLSGERYLGCKQNLRIAVNDRLGIEPDAA